MTSAALQHVMVGGSSILQKRQNDRNEVNSKLMSQPRIASVDFRVFSTGVWSSKCSANTGMGSVLWFLLESKTVSFMRPLVTLHPLAALILPTFPQEATPIPCWGWHCQQEGCCSLTQNLRFLHKGRLW